jgi:hypothetical protein
LWCVGKVDRCSCTYGYENLTLFVTCLVLVQEKKVLFNSKNHYCFLNNSSRVLFWDKKRKFLSFQRIIITLKINVEKGIGLYCRSVYSSNLIVKAHTPHFLILGFVSVCSLLDNVCGVCIFTSMFFFTIFVVFNLLVYRFRNYVVWLGLVYIPQYVLCIFFWYI